MIKQILFAILLSQVLLLVKSVEVNFKLIAVEGTPLVLINGNQIQLDKDEYPLFKKKIDVELPVTYQYVLNGEVESFNRTYEMNPQLTQQTTLNEFFNRRITIKEHPRLPRAYEKFSKSELSKLYDDTFVSTIIIKIDETQLSELYLDTSSEEKIKSVEVFYASPYAIRHFTNATFGLSGQSTTKAQKLSYKLSNLKTEKNKELYKRTSIKLRAEHMDPSFLREKIYGDILNSLGVPNIQNKLTRVFINARPIGLFNLSDNITNKRFLRETLNNGNKYDVVNAIFKADYYRDAQQFGDLIYYGDDPDHQKYGIYYYKGEEDGQTNSQKLKDHLIPLMKEIQDYPQTGKLSMDIQMFLKFMAAEFVCGAIDNFWQKPGNFYIFKDVKAVQWTFLDTDFHYSFGVGGEENEFLAATLDNFVAINKNIPTDRPLIDKLLAVKENKDFLINTIKRLLETSFNTKAVLPRIESFAELLRDDAEWDFLLPRENPTGKVFSNANYESFIDHTSGETSMEGITLKTWFTTRGANIARELNMQYPTEIDTSLGFVETSSMAKGDKEDKNGKNSESSANNTFNVFTTLNLIVIAMISLIFVF